jgi:hypothetical protein
MYQQQQQPSYAGGAGQMAAAAGGGFQSRQIFDGRRMRKPITRRTVDHAASMIRMLEDNALPQRPLANQPYSALEPRPEYSINVAYHQLKEYSKGCLVFAANGLQK